MPLIENLIKRITIAFLIPSLIFFCSLLKLSAEEIAWTEVANTSNKIQFIDINSIKYNNRGMLSVLTKYSEINSNDDERINTNIYLMAIDCDNRLFSQLPEGGDLEKVESWIEPTNDKLIKKTIINSCSY